MERALSSPATRAALPAALIDSSLAALETPRCGVVTCKGNLNLEAKI